MLNSKANNIWTIGRENVPVADFSKFQNMRKTKSSSSKSRQNSLILKFWKSATWTFSPSMAQISCLNVFWREMPTWDTNRSSGTCRTVHNGAQWEEGIGLETWYKHTYLGDHDNLLCTRSLIWADWRRVNIILCVTKLRKRSNTGNSDVALL